jgi:hypothetical protein
MDEERSLTVAAPRQTLSVVDAIAIIVGIVVGAGIFKTPSVVAASAESKAAFLLVWPLGGAISLVGALCYAELASAYPDAGGDYHYFTLSFGKWVGAVGSAWTTRIGFVCGRRNNSSDSGKLSQHQAKHANSKPVVRRESAWPLMRLLCGRSAALFLFIHRG